MFILWRFRQIVLLIFAAVVLTIALNSLVRRFTRVLWLDPASVHCGYRWPGAVGWGYFPGIGAASVYKPVSRTAGTHSQRV